MLDVTTNSWTFVSAKTDFAILAPASGKFLGVTFANAMASNSNTGDVSLRIGFADSTLPAVVNDSATPVIGVFFDHGGIARGGGAVAANGGEIIAVGTVDQPIRLTCSAATGGSIKVVLNTVEMEP